MASEVRRRGDLDGVIGLQLRSEAVWDAKGMYAWYDEVIREIAAVNEEIPIPISDGMGPELCFAVGGQEKYLRRQPKESNSGGYASLLHVQ